MTESQETANPRRTRWLSATAPTVRVRFTVEAEVKVGAWQRMRGHDSPVGPTDAEVRESVLDLARRANPVAMLALLNLISDDIRILP